MTLRGQLHTGLIYVVDLQRGPTEVAYKGNLQGYLQGDQEGRLTKVTYRGDIKG